MAWQAEDWWHICFFSKNFLIHEQHTTIDTNNVFVTLSFFTPSRSTGTPAIWQVAFLNNWCFCGDRWLAYDPPYSQKYSRTFIIPMLCSQGVGPFKSLLSYTCGWPMTAQWWDHLNWSRCCAQLVSLRPWFIAWCGMQTHNPPLRNLLLLPR